MRASVYQFFLALMSTTQSTTPWSSNYAGWHNRTSPLPSTTPILKSDLLLTVTDEAMLGDRFVLALFKPDIAVTSSGQIRKTQADDFAGISKLAEEVSALPISSRDFRGRRSFRVYSEYSCRPFTYLNVAKGSEADERVLDRTSVYGFSKVERGLESGDTLPDVLWELLGLVGEEPRAWDAEVDEDVLRRVNEIHHIEL